MILFLITLLALCVSYFLAQAWKPKNYPPGPAFIPVIGHTFIVKKFAKSLGGLHMAFHHLAKLYKTNVVGLKMGSNLTVVIFSYPLIKQVLTEEIFEGRPDDFFMRLRTMGARRGITGNDGPVWNIQRAFIMKHIKNLGLKKEMLSNLIKQEVVEFSKQLPNCKIEIKKLFSLSVINIIWYFCSGSNIKNNDKRIENVLSLLNARSKAFDMNGGWMNMFPWLRYIIPDKIGYNLICKINEELRDLFSKTIHEHNNIWIEDTNDDLINIYMKEIKSGRPTFTEDQLIIVLLDLFIGGSQTTSITLDFAVMMMILRPDIQEKVQIILDKEFDTRQPIDYSDRHRVPYVEAILMESLRYFGIAPLIGPRRALHDFILDGYTIPKNTTILIHTYSVNHDNTYWEHPEQFRPERFIEENGALKTYDFALPFGLGKRRCPGEHIARSCLFTFFAEVIRKYKITLHPDSEKPSMIAQPGILLSPKPYIAQFIER